jgi:ElaB/YqjD/DUF883 family membrane-anchored ribosome-binding protein
MDQRESRIKEEIEGIRSAMIEKMETIENRVYKTIEGTKSTIDDAMCSIDQIKGTIEETKLAMDKNIDTISLAVDETLIRLKSTADFVDQVKKNPWIMFGTAILIGFAMGCLNRGELLSVHQAQRPQAKSSSELNGHVSLSSLS